MTGRGQWMICIRGMRRHPTTMFGLPVAGFAFGGLGSLAFAIAAHSGLSRIIDVIVGLILLTYATFLVIAWRRPDAPSA